jgi:hypothetical protein
VSSQDGRTRYKIPKNNLQGFDGHQVSLNVQKAELERFKGCKSEAFTEVKNNNIFITSLRLMRKIADIVV